MGRGFVTSLRGVPGTVITYCTRTRAIYTGLVQAQSFSSTVGSIYARKLTGTSNRILHGSSKRRQELPASPCPHRQEADKLEIIEPLNVVLKEARRASVEEVIDVVLGFGLDD